MQPIGFAKFIFEKAVFEGKLGLPGHIFKGRKDKTALYVWTPAKD
jgi:hypothetical protein